jgi:plastocyanin
MTEATIRKPVTRPIGAVSRSSHSMSRYVRYLTIFALAAAGGACAATLEVTVRDPGGGPMPDVAVYAEPATGTLEAPATRSTAVEQVDREFVPYITVIQTGTTVTFPNRDPILHHVYSFSAAKPFEIKLYTGKSPRDFVFDKPGVVTLGCNIHDWMIAYIVVVSTPWFGKTDASGKVRLRDLPAGSYEVKVWHPQQRAEAAARTHALDATANAAASFVLDVAPRKAKYKPPLERARY